MDEQDFARQLAADAGLTNLTEPQLRALASGYRSTRGLVARLPRDLTWADTHELPVPVKPRDD